MPKRSSEKPDLYPEQSKYQVVFTILRGISTQISYVFFKYISSKLAKKLDLLSIPPFFPLQTHVKYIPHFPKPCEIHKVHALIRSSVIRSTTQVYLNCCFVYIRVIVLRIINDTMNQKKYGPSQNYFGLTIHGTQTISGGFGKRGTNGKQITCKFSQ